MWRCALNYFIFINTFQALINLWKNFVQERQLSQDHIPADLIRYREMVLNSHGQIREQNRLPGENDVSSEENLT